MFYWYNTDIIVWQHDYLVLNNKHSITLLHQHCMDQTSFDYNFNLRSEVVEALFCYCITCFNIYKGHNSWRKIWVRVMVFNATFNNVSVISWRSDLLMGEAGIPGENHGQKHWQTLSHNIFPSTPRHQRIRTHNFSGNVTDSIYIGSCKSNYPTH